MDFLKDGAAHGCMEKFWQRFSVQSKRSKDATMYTHHRVSVRARADVILFAIKALRTWNFRGGTFRVQYASMLGV